MEKQLIFMGRKAGSGKAGWGSKGDQIPRHKRQIIPKAPYMAFLRFQGCGEEIKRDDTTESMLPWFFSQQPALSAPRVYFCFIWVFNFSSFTRPRHTLQKVSPLPFTFQINLSPFFVSCNYLFKMKRTWKPRGKHPKT